MKIKNRVSGFTLLEMLLVAAIIGSIMMLLGNYMQQKAFQMRVARTSEQMQQILSAGTMYYMLNNSWPSSLSALSQFLPPTLNLSSPWGGAYWAGVIGANFAVAVTITSSPGKATDIANIIAGQLPLAFTEQLDTQPCNATTTVCQVYGEITPPSQAINTETGAIKFAGLYHHGGCVPVPYCSNGGHPNIFVVPVAVAGTNVTGLGQTFPLQSFTAYATGGTSSSPPGCEANDSSVENQVIPSCTENIVGGPPQTGDYWRACVQIVTDMGDVATTADNGGGGTGGDYPWGGYVTLLALTRCTPPGGVSAGGVSTGEPSGSDYTTVFGN